MLFVGGCALAIVIWSQRDTAYASIKCGSILSSGVTGLMRPKNVGLSRLYPLYKALYTTDLDLRDAYHLSTRSHFATGVPFLGDRLQNGSPYAIRPLSVLSVCYVGVLWPNGWMDQDETWHAGNE